MQASNASIMPKSPLTVATRLTLVLALTATVGACAIVPGEQTYGMRSESSVKLPVSSGDEMVPANVKVEPITAELIIEQDRALKAAATQPGASTKRKGPAIPALPAATDYKLGAGDVLTIVVWDHPELTIPAGSYRTAEQAGSLIGADGTFFYPYAGLIQAAGKTAREIRDVLTKKLAAVIEKPQVDVRVAAFRSKRIYVVGEVKQPGLIDLTDVPLTVVDAVNKLGGFTNEADHSNILLTRQGATWRLDLQALYENGISDYNILLEHGDVINISDRQQNMVFILGEVKQPGPQFMVKKRLSLAQALAQAGHLDQYSSNPNWIFVMRNDEKGARLFHLNSKTPDALLLAERFPLQPRDIVYVDAAEVARVQRVFANILPAAQSLYYTSQTKYPLFGGRNDSVR